MCGFKNAANVPRCVSCGAKLETLGPVDRNAEEEYERRHQQDGFAWKWALISFGVYVLLQAIILVVLDTAIDAYDPQGIAGIMISAAVWFVGGVVVGFISPGRTFIEPAVGAVFAAFPTVAYLMHIDVVYKLSLLAYIIGGLIGIMITLFGAFLGEKAQMLASKGQRA
jgi:hypothetical protein